MRDRNSTLKWRKGSVIEWKKHFFIGFLFGVANSSRNVSHGSTPIDQSIEIVPIGDVDDNQDRSKIVGPRYDASADRTLSVVTVTETVDIYHSIKPETPIPDIVITDPKFYKNESESHKNKYQMEFLDSMLLDYDKRAWPTYGTRDPTIVFINMYINSIGSISASEMDYNMDIYLRQSWVDSRLALKSHGINKAIFLNGENIVSRIWTPDLFFRNVKEAKFPSVSNPNILIKLGPQGEILYSTRLALKLSCHMSFQNYPLDKQECHVIMGSSSYTADVLRLSWMYRSILLDHNMEIPDYYLAKVTKSKPYFRSFILTGTFSFLNASFTFNRQNGYHMVQTYLPTFLIVMISWVSFWLSVDATPARTTLGVTTLLTLTTVATGVRRQIPPVSYIKAVDIWIGACSIMVFGALVEFALVNYLSRSKLKGPPWKKICKISHWMKKWHFKIPHLEGPKLEVPIPEDVPTVLTSQKDRNSKNARNLDRFSRISFPTVFFFFNFIYWIYYIYLAQ